MLRRNRLYVLIRNYLIQYDLVFVAQIDVSVFILLTPLVLFFFFLINPATPEISPFPLHAALPIGRPTPPAPAGGPPGTGRWPIGSRRHTKSPSCTRRWPPYSPASEDATDGSSKRCCRDARSKIGRAHV